MCKPEPYLMQRFTIVAIQCDAREETGTQRSESFLSLVRYRDWWGRVATQAATRSGPSGVKRGEPYRGSEGPGGMVHSVVVSAQADVQRTFNPCGQLAKPARKPEDVSTGHHIRNREKRVESNTNNGRVRLVKGQHTTRKRIPAFHI